MGTLPKSQFFQKNMVLAKWSEIIEIAFFQEVRWVWMYLLRSEMIRYRQMDESCGQVFCKIIEIPVKHGFHQIKFSKSFRKLCFFVAMELCHALCVAVCYGDVCVNFLSVFTWFAVAGYVTSHYFEKNHNLKKIAFSEFWRIFVFFFEKIYFLQNK